MLFTLGQRWISDTESELGLGTIVAIDTRSLTVYFSAADENRLYAKSDAPITRVKFNQGDVIKSHEGWQLQVEKVQENEGILTYIGLRLDLNEPDTLLSEVMLDNQLTFSKPQDRLFAGQIDKNARFTLRFRALKNQSEQFRFAWSGLRGMRTALIPHQLYIAHEISKRYAPRVLLADEVGLGKTIEAGMVIHQRLLSGAAERVLIIVPDSLQYQWLIEMLRRFNLHFSLFDEERYNEASFESSMPFETEQLVICSLSFVCRNKQRLEQLIETPWDLLVVDEAHHLVWDQQSPSREYLSIEKLAHQIPSVLLLTATPEQLGQESHFARLRLLDPDRFYHYADFVKEQQQYQPIADAVTLLMDNQPLSNNHCSLLTNLFQEQDITPLLSSINSQSDNHIQARQELITMLMDRHGTSRVLFRNTRHGVSGFPKRILQQIKLPLPTQYQTVLKVANIINSKKAMVEKANDLLYPEQLYQLFEGEEATWWTFDPRIEWLLTYVTTHRHEKMLIICSKAETAIQLEKVLREKEAIRSAIFHEELSLLERDKAAAYFAETENGAQLLICSEIGSEGRNFQFAHHLIMFDLPFNPDLLEQRIGRLDRIGQKNDITILVPYIENTSQSILVQWYHEGLNAFEQTCPVGRAIYDDCYDVLIQLLADPANQDGLDEFILHSRQRHDALKTTLEQGRDRLLELHSHGGENAQQLVKDIAKQDEDIQLVNFTLNLFDIIGIDQEDHSDNLLIITPSDHMLFPDFPGLPQEGCTITFNRDLALSREDVYFINWEHPIIRHGIDLITSSDIGSCAVTVLKNKSLPAGTLLLETIYLVETQSLKSLQLKQFLPPTPIRLLLDKNGNNLAEKVNFEHLNRQLTTINRHNASKIVNALQEDIHTILQKSEKLVENYATDLIKQAYDNANKSLNNEITRLIALKTVNPSIRNEEISGLDAHRKEILAQLNQANWRLDSLRVIVVSHQ